jgi:hypothetical protein
VRNSHTIISECNLIIDFLHFPQNVEVISKKTKNKTLNKILNSNNLSSLFIIYPSNISFFNKKAKSN